MQSAYDKAIMALSRDALGISRTFLKDIVLANGVRNGFALLSAWSCWGASVTCILISFHSSVAAHQKAVFQLDGKNHLCPKTWGKVGPCNKKYEFISRNMFCAWNDFYRFFAASNLP